MMYGYQGNNSQPYNYQNASGSSYGNIGQYTGPYHSYYSNASTAYNSFPSNDQSCSSLGVLPQEYSQVGNTIHRPYYFDSNSSYHRPYQPLPYNQSIDIPVANSYSTCPRNCHCCESINPKYFPASNSLQQQANNQTICDSSLNATYNGFRKGLNSSRWRESNTQQSNILETSDSSTSWTMPKYGTSCKGEPCVWPLSQKQSSKFESSEHIAAGNGFILPQQHQRKPITSSQAYSGLHSNTLLSVQAPRPPQGRNDDLMGNCFAGYPCGSDYKKGVAEHAPYSKPHINKIPPPNRPICNLSSNCEGGFSYKFSSLNTNVYHENQKCAIDSPKLVPQLPSTLVESYQRRLPSSNVLEGSNEMSYCQPGLISSVHPIDPPTRRTYSIPTEGDSRILLSCGSSTSSDVLQSSRLQLPPIHSLKPTGIVMSGPPKDLCDEISYDPSLSSNRCSLDNSNRISGARNSSFSNSSMRNINSLSSEKLPDRYNENAWRNQPEIGDRCNLKNAVPSSIHSGKQFYSELSSDYVETEHKLKISRDAPLKPSQSVVGNAVVGDLRHFLSTWDDGDDEESCPVTPCVSSVAPDGDQEQLAQEDDVQEECASATNLPVEVDNHATVTGNSIKFINDGKELPISNAAIVCTSSYKAYDCASDINSFRMQSDTVLGIGETDVNNSSISLKPCSELEQHSDHTVVKSSIVSSSNSEQVPQKICSPFQNGPNSNSDPHSGSHDISDKSKSCCSPHIDDLNALGREIEDSEESPNMPIGVGNEVNTEELDSSPSQVLSSGIVDGSPAKENEKETLTHHLDVGVRNMEESSGIVNVENTISGNEGSKSLEVRRHEDEPKSEIAISLMNNISSSSFLEDPNVQGDKFSSSQNPGCYLSLKKPESSCDVFTLSNFKAKGSVMEVEGNTDGSNLKGLMTKEMENGKSMNDEEVSDPCDKVDDKFHDDSCNDGQELEFKKDSLKDTSYNHDNDVIYSSPTEGNDVLTGKLVSSSSSEKIVTNILEGTHSSEGQVFYVPHMENKVHNEVIDRKTHSSAQQKSFDDTFLYHEGSQKQSQSKMLHSLPITKNYVCEKILGADDTNLSVKEFRGVSPKEFSTSKSIVERKNKVVNISRRVTQKSSYEAALLLRKKYQVIVLKNRKRGTLAKRRNGECLTSKFPHPDVRKARKGNFFVKKHGIINSESYCCNTISQKLGEITEDQILPPVDIHDPEKDVLSLKNGVDGCCKNLKGVDSPGISGDEVLVTHSVHVEQISFSKEGNKSASPVIESVIESSVENDIRAKSFNQDGEHKSLILESSYVAGEEEILMGKDEEKSSLEEGGEGTDAENVIHREASSKEESNNVQYWCNYELGNDLGVAMEIEVGSDVSSSDGMESKQPVENGIFPCNGMDEKGLIVIEGEITGHQGGEEMCAKEQNNIRVIKEYQEHRAMLQRFYSAGVDDCQGTSVSDESCGRLENSGENVPESITSHLDDYDKNSMAMVESDSAHKSSADTVTSDQPKELKDHIKESKLKISSSKDKDAAHNERFRSLKLKITSSVYCTDLTDSIKLHSKLSNAVIQTEENGTNDSTSSYQDLQVDGRKSTPPSTLDCGRYLIDGPQEIIIQKKHVVCEDGYADHQVSVKMNDGEFPTLVPTSSYKCDKNNLLTLGNQQQMSLESIGGDNCDLSGCKQGSNQRIESAHKSTGRKCGKKNNNLKHTIDDSMKESPAIIQQKVPSTMSKILKTKASLKYFDNVLHKNGRNPKYGFWKNRYSYHKRIFGHKFKKFSSLQNWKDSFRHIMAGKFKYKLPQILQLSITPPPKILSPLHAPEDFMDTIIGEKYPDVSQPKFNAEPLKRHDEENTYVPLCDSEIPTSQEKNIRIANSKSSFTIHPTEYDSQEMDVPEVADSARQNGKDKVSDLHFLKTPQSSDSTPPILEETKASSSSSMMNSSLIDMSSNSCESPHVRMSFKKVLNGNKKNLWMKRLVNENSLKKQDIFPSVDSKIVKRKGSLDCDSPLPKVTIKKKSGEKGYQSFLSGFSSASSSPSTSPTFLSKSSSPVHLAARPEVLPSVKCNGFLHGNTIGELSPKDFKDSMDSLQLKKSKDIPCCEIAGKISSDKHTFYTNIVEKKEGSGLVFVIRTVGGKIKGCTGKDKECDHSSGIKDGGHTNPCSSSSVASVVDDDWELGPWSIWQPVVKLSRSCELDLLALKMHSPSDDMEGKHTHDKVSNTVGDNGVPAIAMASSPVQCHKQESKELGKKSKFHRGRECRKNEYGEIILSKNGPLINYGTNKVEFDMIMRECDRLHLPKKKPKPENKFQSVKGSKNKKNTHFFNSVNGDVKKKVCLDRKEVITKFGQSISSKATLVNEHSVMVEKIELDSETNSNVSVTGMSSVGQVKGLQEEKIVRSNTRDNKGRKAKRKSESECINDAECVIKVISPDILSPSEMKEEPIPTTSAHDLELDEITRNKVMDDSGVPEEASCLVQESGNEHLQGNSVNCVVEKEATTSDRFPYACEACCRTFSSQKWLSRHCRGVSHSRVENAQRQAVQALLLLFTGSESHLLQPLSEKELDHLKSWPSRAVPSPLQLALNELLNAT